MKTWLRLGSAAIALTLSTPWGLASEADYPTRPIKLVVPYPPGGGLDDIARMVGQKVSTVLGQPVLIENKPGANGAIGGDFVAKSSPDGYTVLIDNSSLVINPALRKMPFDAGRELAPVTLAATQDSMLLAHPSLTVKSVLELIAYAKANPGKLNYGSPGTGSPQHIGMEMFNRMAGTQMVHIPFKGGAPATNALLAGEVHLLLSGTTGLPFVKSGRVKVLATTGAMRSRVLSDVPIVAESGLRDYQLINWQAVLVPAKTPPAIIAKLHRAFVYALNSPEVSQTLVERNFVVVASTPAELSKVMTRGLALPSQF